MYGIPAPDVGDQVMAAMVLTDGAVFDPEVPRVPCRAAHLGPKQWPSLVRVGSMLPRTETFKVIKRQLQAQGIDCEDQVYPIER